MSASCAWEGFRGLHCLVMGSWLNILDCGYQGTGTLTLNADGIPVPVSSWPWWEKVSPVSKDRTVPPAGQCRALLGRVEKAAWPYQPVYERAWSPLLSRAFPICCSPGCIWIWEARGDVCRGQMPHPNAGWGCPWEARTGSAQNQLQLVQPHQAQSHVFSYPERVFLFGQ